MIALRVDNCLIIKLNIAKILLLLPSSDIKHKVYINRLFHDIGTGTLSFLSTFEQRCKP
jgi:hypothetical protein